MNTGVYDFASIEKKWQDYWQANRTFRAIDGSACSEASCAASGSGSSAAQRPKFYVLDMFPYPSAQGLHVGHPEGYTASDIIARYKRATGFNVLHPIGWDAFGLPAEQYAIQSGTHPAVTTQKNIGNMRRQIRSLGFSYDWDRQVDTTDPGYYKWTQWIFLKLYNSFFDEDLQKARPIEQLPVPQDIAGKGGDAVRDYIDSRRLAYQSEAPVNWCPALGTVLANEEVIGGVSERGGHPVMRRSMRQWMLRITKYAQRLLDGLEGLDWPESIKKLQRDWIGKSVGAEVDFRLDGSNAAIRVFTTRPDTLFGATYMVLAPEHPLVEKITTSQYSKAIEEYKRQAAGKSDLDRTDLAKEKTGQFTGAYAVNPVNGQKIPVWISDYVLISYGTGAIMAVPAHDERDFAFATKYDLPIIKVVEDSSSIEVDRSDGTVCFTGDGIAVNSGRFDGLSTPQFKEKITAWLQDRGLGRNAVNYKLRDWLFSRQRYWGEPFPIIHTQGGGTVALDESQLPLMLPQISDFAPTGTAEPPLARAADWVNMTLPDGAVGRRETNTMPQWAGSCWYYLRYLDPQNGGEPFAKEKERYWMPVDLYIGGAEHAVLHLLYSRFWHKLLYDLGCVSTDEPFAKLVNQGMILGADNQKMSKSRGNVINPDRVIADYGADSMRMYEMFMGPLDATKPWSMQGVEGVYRFLCKVWRMIIDEQSGRVCSAVQDVQADARTLRILHQTIKKVGGDIERFAFNTAISQMMIFVNHLGRQQARPRSVVERFVLILSPFAPHICEELWQRLGKTDSLAYEPWPQYDADAVRDDVITLPVQINGKLRGRLEDVPAGISEEESIDLAKEQPSLKPHIAGREIKKVIFVPNRLLNLIVK